VVVIPDQYASSAGMVIKEAINEMIHAAVDGRKYAIPTMIKMRANPKL
jgi:D-alanine-D-alanine ligase-like ATP-grasp enzyme